MQTTSICVTGANGFVGNRLSALLSTDTADVLCVSRTPIPKTQSNITPDTRRYLVMPEQSANTDWSAALAGIDCVIHCAARVHVMQESDADPISLFRQVNRDSTLNLARQAAACGVSQFIFISSIKVNGEATRDGRSFTELDTAHPEDPYGISKAEAEQALLAFAANSTMAVTIIRPPLVYGPGVKANFLSMMKWVERGIPLPLGSINNRRSFVYLDNLISLIACCISNPNAYNQVF